MMNIIAKCHERKRKKFLVFFSSKASYYETSYLACCCNEHFPIYYGMRLKYAVSSLILFACGAIFIKPTNTILIASLGT